MDSNFTENFGASYKNVAQNKSRRGTLENGAESSIFLLKAKLLETHPVKINNTNSGQMSTVIYISGNHGRIIRLTYQP